jgi:hypothetical protein
MPAHADTAWSCRRWGAALAQQWWPRAGGVHGLPHVAAAWSSEWSIKPLNPAFCSAFARTLTIGASCLCLARYPRRLSG